ncbi:aromatase/cyclase [Micromonospora halophytica]|uniref:Aromatase n=1 Tax=Micromonospora halophytica TaxID=47864 RepID=A0A1C5IJC6_9ACTN|nr:aromatase/cyclase [Micromonospora halophytica]SCG58492.1 aromatase [Micromonospora halophytica]
MPTLNKDTIQHTATVAAPATLVFDLVADLGSWPQFHGPSVHAEPLGADEHGQLFRHWWVIDDHTVRTWQASWHFDREQLRIRYEFAPHQPGAAGARGEWILHPSSDSSTEVRLEQAAAGDGSYDAAGAERELRELLNAVRTAAEHDEERRDLVVDFEDPLFVAGSLDAAYEYLYEADKWPERIPHVSRLVLEERVPNIQFFDMDTHTPDGSPHTTRSVRICLPNNKIVYKQIHLPKLLDGHTGHWRFTPTREGFILGARHTAVIKPSALPILGADTTVLDARKYLRRVLSANSMSNLRLAKAYAEEQHHA